jgi:hypothetical protein
MGPADSPWHVRPACNCEHPSEENAMDEEAKQILREIRDALVRQEDLSRRFKRFVFGIVVVLQGVVAFMLIRLERIIDVDQAAPPAGAARGAP